MKKLTKPDVVMFEEAKDDDIIGVKVIPTSEVLPNPLAKHSVVTPEEE